MLQNFAKDDKSNSVKLENPDFMKALGKIKVLKSGKTKTDLILNKGKDSKSQLDVVKTCSPEQAKAKTDLTTAITNLEDYLKGVRQITAAFDAEITVNSETELRQSVAADLEKEISKLDTHHNAFDRAHRLAKTEI